MDKPPTSPQRKAEFREIARQIHARAVNPAQSIAAALEKAFQRGWQEATYGAPPEPDVLDCLPWTQIPPRPRQVLNELCQYASGTAWSGRCSPFSSEDASHRMMLQRQKPNVLTPARAGPPWSMFVRLRRDSEWSFHREAGNTTIDPLIRLGLLESVMANGTEFGFLTTYGIASWLSHQQANGPDY